MSETMAKEEFRARDLEMWETMSVQVNIKMSPTDYDRFCKIADYNDLNRSELVRRWIKLGNTGEENG